MSDSPSPEAIVTALKKSGYLMEQVVATQLETFGFHVWTNWAFEDSDEGKSREIDIRAIKRVAHNEEKHLSAFVEILVECKNSLNPYVFIERQKNQTDIQDAPQEFIFPIQYESRKKIDANPEWIQSKDAFFHLGFDKTHYDFVKEYKAVQFCRIDRKSKGWTANHGGLYDAMFYPMAKAVTARQKDIRRTNGHFWFLIPIVVLSGDIFCVESTESDPVLNARDYVTFKREIRSSHLNGTFTVDFVRQKQLELFFSNCVDPLAARMVDLAENHADFVLKKDLSWDE